MNDREEGKGIRLLRKGKRGLIQAIFSRLGLIVLLFLLQLALLLGLPICWALVPALLAGLVCSLLFIAIGLLCGTVLNDKQVGGKDEALLDKLRTFVMDECDAYVQKRRVQK